MIGGIRRLFSMVFRRNHGTWFMWNSRYDYSHEVGDGTGSSTVMAPVLWTATTFPEAPPTLWRQLGNGQEEIERDHDLIRLLERPNPFYTGPLLWMATIADYKVNGNGYWIKEWNRAGTRPVRLWFTPSWMIEPRGSDTDQSVFIEYYNYKVDGEEFRLDPRDVVHFRFGLDSENPRKGFSSLRTVLREVYTDDEAARFTASLLRNMGIPGLIVSPDTDQPISEQEAKDTKQYMKDKFGGDRRGEPMVMTGRTKVEQFGFSPDQLLLRDLRRIPEERVTAVLGVPAIVAGLGAGLDRSTFTNMAEAREAAYESGIIPTQRIISEDIRYQLLSDFEDDVHNWRFGFDLSKVRVLQEDLYRQAQRNDLMIRGGWGMVAEGRRAMGLEVDDARDEVFLRPLNINTIPAADAGDFIERPIPNTPPVVDPSVQEAYDLLSGDVERLQVELQAVSDRPTTDPAIITAITGLAAMVRESNVAMFENAKSWSEARPVDPELVSVLNAIANREPDTGYSDAMKDLAEAVRTTSTMDERLIALVSAIAERPTQKTISWSDDRKTAIVKELTVA